MRLVATPIAALVVAIAIPATAQLEESYTEKGPPVTQPAGPEGPPKPERPRRIRPPRPVLSYDADKPIPPGYHYEERPRDNLLIGALIAGVSGIGLGAMFLGMSAQNRDRDLAIGGVLVAGAGASTGLIFLFAWSELDPKKVVVRNGYTASLSPVVSKQTLGGSLAISF